MHAFSHFIHYRPFSRSHCCPRRPQSYRSHGSELRTQRYKATDTTQPATADASVAFAQLLKSLRVEHAVELKGGPRGLGLFTLSSAPKGSVILTLPQSICIAINNESGELSLPGRGDWPRLREGLGAPEPLSWDILESLALMDAVAGDGDKFYEAYADMLLPDPEQLTLPMCWHDQLLQELQHKDIIDAAQQQQVS